jgi:hypothetical protein
MVDLVDLTWEQKEQVLRELFSRMNGAKNNKQNQKTENLAISHDNRITSDSNDEDNDSLKYVDVESKSKSSSNRNSKTT